MPDKICIIGAGPVGSYVSFLLASSGFDVTIFEEHHFIGKPVQCTGLVTRDIFAIRHLAKAIKNSTLKELEGAKVISPDGNSVSLRLFHRNLVLDREKFDSLILKMALDSGAVLYIKHKLKDIKEGHLIFSNHKSVKFDICIGADGPGSIVAKRSGLMNDRRYWVGVQARVRLGNKGIIEFYPRSDGYAWLVPESERIVRMGLAVKEGVAAKVEDFIKKRILQKNIIEWQGGLIPYYDPKIGLQKGNIFLVGDAATQVKATTGGGIVPGLLAASALAESIIKHRDYKTLCRKVIGKRLNLHLKLRKKLDNFTDADYNRLIAYCKRPKVTEILGRSDRENPSSLLFSLLFAEPRFLSFLLK